MKERMKGWMGEKVQTKNGSFKKNKKHINIEMNEKKKKKNEEMKNEKRDDEKKERIRENCRRGER